ncbi:MAG: glycosyltransferase [Burkholderiales bacterium]|nr:glycosyltransferase [Burkholderiales bacterium]
MDPGTSLRIVQVLHSHGYGGAEQHTLTLMEGLSGRGHDVLYAGPEDSWLAERCKSAGLPTCHLRMTGLYDFPSYLKLRRLCMDWRADVIHAHGVRGSKYSGLAHGPAVPVCTAHATTARKHMGRCRRIIAVSNAVRSTLLQAGYNESRVALIHHGIADEAGGNRTALRRELQIGDEEFAVFNAGRFIRDKGQDLLVQAMRQMSRGTLYLAGDPTTSFGLQVQKEAAGDRRIIFLGYRSDVRRLLPAFDVYISGSRREALGLALLEAAAAGLPIVATNVGGVPEVVRNGLNGILTPPEDGHALAQALAILAEDRRQASIMGQAGRREYLDRFTLANMISKTESVYAQALAEAAG